MTLPVFKNVLERSTTKNYRPVSLLPVASKIIEKLVSNRIVDHLEKFVLFPDLHFGFWSFRSTADLLTVVSDRIARAFSRSAANLAVVLAIFKAFDWVWHAAFFQKLKSYGISGKILGLFLFFSIIGGIKWFWMGSLHKNIQSMLDFLKAAFLVLHFSYYTLMTLLMMLSAILLSMLMILLSILSMIRHLICSNN